MYKKGFLRRRLPEVAVMLVLVAYSAVVAASETVYTIARAPQLSMSKTEKAWTPFITYLNQETSYRFKLKLYNNREKFEQDIKKARVDFYFGNPGYAVVGHLNDGYKPILRSDKKKLQGIVVVRKDSPYQSITELNHKRLVFPGKTAFAASLLIKYHLDQGYKLEFEEGYVVGHDNVYRNVLNGSFDAGGAVHKTLNREPEEIRNQLRIIYESPGVASHPLSSSQKVPDEVNQAIITATLALDETAEGNAILKKIKLSKPVVADYSAEYQPLEALIKQVYGYLLK